MVPGSHARPSPLEGGCRGRSQGRSPCTRTGVRTSLRRVRGSLHRVWFSGERPHVARPSRPTGTIAARRRAQTARVVGPEYFAAGRLADTRAAARRRLELGPRLCTQPTPARAEAGGVRAARSSLPRRRPPRRQSGTQQETPASVRWPRDPPPGAGRRYLQPPVAARRTGPAERGVDTRQGSTVRGSLKRCRGAGQPCETFSLGGRVEKSGQGTKSVHSNRCSRFASARVWLP